MNLQQNISLKFKDNSLQQTHFTDLDHFREKLEENQETQYHQPLTASHKKTSYYQTIFFGLGILFALLGFIVHEKTSFATSFVHLIQGVESIKGLVCALCATFATGAWIIALNLHKHKEAVSRLRGKARERLGRLYRRKRADFGFQHSFPFGPQSRKELVFQQIYRDAKDKLKDRGENTLALLKEIQKSKTLIKDQQEALSHQALIELGEQLNIIICQFGKTQQP